jgi:hypothetical protein
MTRIARAAVGAAGLTRGALPLLVPIAVADPTRPPTKAHLEQLERPVRPAHPTKAQIERNEHARATSGRTGTPRPAGARPDRYLRSARWRCGGVGGWR